MLFGEKEKRRTSRWLCTCYYVMTVIHDMYDESGDGHGGEREKKKKKRIVGDEQRGRSRCVSLGKCEIEWLL